MDLKQALINDKQNDMAPIEKHAKVFAAPDITSDGRKAIIGQSLDDIETAMQEMQLPKFRGKQVYQWIYQKGATSFDEMTNLGKDLRARLEDYYTLERPDLTAHQKSTDGTEKFLLKMADGQEIETVFIPERTRGTLCVSSQVGCTLACKFCHTGTQNLVRNLSAREIVLQVMRSMDALGEWPVTNNTAKKLSNVVFMGMGEPLYNYDNVAKAVKILTDENGIGLSKRKVTISTSGVVPLIEKCGHELGTGLAISLHAVSDELRNYLVPLNRKYPIKDLMKACENYPGVGPSRKITFEYVMLKDINDSDEEARELVRLLKNIPAKVNLIPFNPWPGAVFESSSNNRVRAFAAILERAGYESPVRRPRGQDILAACGQLRSESVREKLIQKKKQNENG